MPGTAASRVDVVREGGTAVVTVHGDLDVYSADQLSQALEGGVADRAGSGGELLAVVVDVTDVPFVDSAALGALLAGYRRWGGRGVPVLVAGASGQLLRLLRLTGVDRVLSLHDDRAGALAAARAAAPSR